MTLRKPPISRRWLGRARLLWNYLTGAASMTRKDVLLSSFPKSGNTWVRFFLANLISTRYWNGREVTFPLLDDTMPELGASDLRKPWRYPSVPRVIKTHLPFCRWFGRFRSIGLVRDPRDVMISYHRYLRDRERPLFEGELSQFLRHPKFGLAAWFKHTSRWRPHWGLIVKYEDLRSRPVQEFMRLSDWLELGLDGDDVTELVERSSLRRVKKSSLKSPPRRMRGDQAFQFIRDGRVRQWQRCYSDADLDYFRRLRQDYGVDLYRASHMDNAQRAESGMDRT